MEENEKDKEKKCLEIAKLYIQKKGKEPVDKYIFRYRGRRDKPGPHGPFDAQGRSLPYRGPEAERPLLVVDAEFKMDPRTVFPGGGKSLRLLIDLEKKSVVRELGFQ